MYQFYFETLSSCRRSLNRVCCLCFVIFILLPVHSLSFQGHEEAVRTLVKAVQESRKKTEVRTVRKSKNSNK